MEVKLEPKFSKGAGVKSCYSLCTHSFIQLCSVERNFAFQVLQATPRLLDTAGHKGIEHPLEDHLCCLVIKHASWNSFSSFKTHIPRQGSQWALGVSGLHGKVLGVGTAAGVAAVRGSWKRSPCLTMTASSEMDPLLARAKPISDSGSTSGIRYLVKISAELQPEGNNPADPKASERGRGDVADARAEAPLQPTQDHRVQRFTCSPWRGPHRAGGCKKRLWSMGSPCRSRLLAGSVAPRTEEHMLEQVCSQDLWPHGRPPLK